VPLRRGRVFSERDTSDAPRVVVINEALARTYFPNEDPVGRETDRGTIIGVVGDVRSSALDRPAIPEIYYTFTQNTAATPDAGVTLVVGTGARPEALAAAVRAAIREVNPRQVVFDTSTMERVIANSLSDVNLYVWLIGMFAVLAVLLAASGVYGVISYVVASRTPEFGLRMALGAEGSQILRLVFRQAATLVACGMLIGLAGALAAARLLEGMVRGVRSSDPAAMAVAAIVLAATGLAACLVPARRAMRVDPNITLK
jgi:ABC-type antimicrobial peptide transport system permease subunit